ncbi:16274_t:CDS:2 [Funneliformis geosporum]|nr:16274_t:CDS:2 [Funneliformis geosporum]
MIKDYRFSFTRFLQARKFIPPLIAPYVGNKPEIARKNLLILRKETENLTERGEIKLEKDINYPKNGTCIRENENINYKGKVDLNNFGKTRAKITNLNISKENLTGHLDLEGFSNLVNLNCENNQLTNLNLSDCSSLNELHCNDNQLTNLNFLDTLPYPENLTQLFIINNKINSNLTSLSKLVNLEQLFLGNNPLFGSLAPLRDCPKLENLHFNSTNLTLDLQYLPLSLRRITRCDDKIKEELALYGKELVVDSNDYNRSKLKIVTTIPNYLTEHLSEIKKKNEKSITDLPSHLYEKITTRYFSLSSLPLRLYNLKTNQVEETKEKQPQKYGQSYQTDLTKLDNFCINQSDPKEKGQEVAKQQQYYNNATATLIAIDAKIGEKKETEGEFAKHGLLSKQTIFMFDDGLVDGRILVNFWGKVQETKSKHSVQLTLSQALAAVAHRQQTVPVDGFYSILGLLSYGNKVKINYKGNLCLSCKNQEDSFYEENKTAIVCEHSPRTEYPRYFVEELNAELKKMMEIAMTNGAPYEVVS